MKSFTRPTKRTAIIGGAAGIAIIGAIGAGAAGAAFAADTPAPQPSASAPSGAATPGAAAPNGRAHGGPGARAHTPHIGGDVLAVDGSSITVRDPEGFTRTIVLAGDAKVTKDGATSTAAAIVKGVHIEATGTVASNGTALDATAVTIGRPVPPAGGPADGSGARGPKGAEGGKGHPGRGASDGAAPAPSGTPAAPASPSASAPASGS